MYELAGMQVDHWTLGFLISEELYIKNKERQILIISILTPHSVRINAAIWCMIDG